MIHQDLTSNTLLPSIASRARALTARVQLSSMLGISRSTLQHHIAALYAKLGCTNRAQAAVYGVHREMDTRTDHSLQESA